ncbi:hypothetical protein IJT93_04175 [bacterium]|nr:hypothetical protein [bacterium]
MNNTELNANFYNDVRSIFTEKLPEVGGYSVRSGQVEMALSVARSLVSGRFLTVQAGTGVGKTLAYLVPSVIWRLKYGSDPIIISTNTTNLQQQIVDKDYPFICRRLGIPFRLLQAYGRSRYLCLAKLYRLRSNIWRLSPEAADFVGCLSELADIENDSLFYSDRDAEAKEFNGTISEFRSYAGGKVAWNYDIWNSICCDSYSCTKRSCRHYRSCYFYRARQALQGADICVVNHALLCSIMAKGGLGLLFPKICAVIIDEAHHFEDVAAAQSSGRFDRVSSGIFFNSFESLRSGSDFKFLNPDGDLAAFMSEDTDLFGEISDGEDVFGEAAGRNDLYRHADKDKARFAQGWFADVHRVLQKDFDFLGEASERLDFSLQAMYNSSFLPLKKAVKSFLEALQDYYDNQAYKLLDCFEKDSQTAFLDEGWLKKGGVWGEVLEEQIKRLEISITDFRNELFGFACSWEDVLLQERGLDDDNPLSALIGNGQYLLNDFNSNFAACCKIDENSETRGFWLEVNKADVSLKSALLDVSDFIYDNLFAQIKSVVMTSATLKAGDDFSFFQSRVGLNRAEEDKKENLTVKSPFRYQTQALMGIVSDYSRLSDSKRFIRSAASFISEAVRLWQGRTLVLATSKFEVRQICDLISEPLKRNGITVLRQSSGLRAEYVNRMRRARQNREKVVLVGTDSFWEGVDVPGEALSCVIILRLPFTPPDNPIFKIRSRRLGNMAFTNYALPQAVLKFCQGVGRLVRTEKDSGVVFVLDNRLAPDIGKSYGGRFLKTMPPFGVFCRDGDTIINSAWNWYKFGENPEGVRYFS